MSDRTTNSTALKRSAFLGFAFLAVFAVLLLRILTLQTFSFEKYQSKVIDQVTTSSPVAANRGKIYDRNGNVLATNITTYRLFISPSSIEMAEEEEGKSYSELIANGLSSLVEGVEYEDVYKQATEYTEYLDRTIARKVEESKADEIREFISEYELENMVYLEAQSTRYYPAGDLAAHVLGFVSNDGDGLYGLELQYDSYLSGVDGYYIKARDSYGREMPFEYASYIDAIDGYNITTTLDSTVQSFLEEELAATVEKFEVTNRACGIVIDVNTGAILAMATSSPFDLNDPWQLDEVSEGRLEQLIADGYDEQSDEYNDLSRELLTTMWSNKAITESYIPGSTFKIITSSMALEEQVVSLTESVNCPGHKTVLGHTIRCHETKGHGALSFAQGLQQSCNVWFMTLGERVGIERYQEYVEIFGYNDKTGIDLPGEGNSIFASEMTALDLAIYAFGQNFTVTPIQQIAAVASVANGGQLLAPYLVEKITDNAGNVIFAHEVEQKRETISEDTCRIISQILEEGVSGDGGANKAYVAGYRVAAKTGTSEKKERECPKCGSTGVPHTVDEKTEYICSICKYRGEEDDFPVSEKYICSTVAYAPADDPQIAVLIMVDEPTKGSLYGSTVAAPYVGNVLENSLPYLGVEALYSAEELENMRIKVSSYKNWSVERATRVISEAGLRYKVIGSGEYVTSQLPAAGTYIEEVSGTIVLYAGSEPEETVTVPDLSGMVATTANQALINLGLNIRIEGADSYLSGTGYTVVAQSVAPGEKVAAGTVITVTFSKKSGS